MVKTFMLKTSLWFSRLCYDRCFTNVLTSLAVIMLISEMWNLVVMISDALTTK